jgi:hypothetical protein
MTDEGSLQGEALLLTPPGFFLKARGDGAIGPNLDVYAVAKNYSDRLEISPAKRKFRLRNDFVSPGTLASY